MRFRGIILTGTSGAGKTTISELLRKTHPRFQQVQAVTTRAPRPDDAPGSYAYLSAAKFDRLGDALVIWARYREQRYGITREAIAEVEGRGKAPILIITAQSLAEYLERGGSDPPFLTVFLDAPDDVLDVRLAQRGALDRRKIEHQRSEDRRYRVGRVLENIDLERSLQQLVEWWRQEPVTS